MNIQGSKFSALGVPIDCKGIAGGTELSPQALRDASFIKLLQMEDRGDLNVALRDPLRDPSSGMIAYRDVCATTQELRIQTRTLLAQNKIPFFIGGCCTQLVGIGAGMRDHFGEAGVVYLDGHLDLYDGKTSPTGEAADMPLAILVGRGPTLPETIIGASPIINPKNVYLLGYRDLEDAQSRGSLLPADIEPAMKHIDSVELRNQGCKAVGQNVAQDIEMRQMPFLLHIDVDILDQDIFPTTDYLMPGGLDWQEFGDLVLPLFASSQLKAVALSCYNPERDKDSSIAKKLVQEFSLLLCSHGCPKFPL